MEEEDAVGHGIAILYYIPVGPGLCAPVLECLCGLRCEGATWEEAGQLLDEHLEKNGVI